MKMILDIDLVDIKEVNRVVKETHNFDLSKLSLTSYRRKIIHICNELSLESVDVLITKLKDVSFFETFCSMLIVDVTELFRDPSFWRVLKKELKAKFQNANKIRIWVAGCSSGEELLSLTILLRGIGMLEKASIVTTEINELSFTKVRKMKYSLHSLKIANANYERLEFTPPLESFYKEEKDTIIYDDSLLENVVFKPLYLGTDKIKGNFDLILCRNTLIYYDKATQDTIQTAFYNNLLTGGMLALGVCEEVTEKTITEKLSLLNSEEKVYIKSISKQSF